MADMVHEAEIVSAIQRNAAPGKEHGRYGTEILTVRVRWGILNIIINLVTGVENTKTSNGDREYVPHFTVHNLLLLK